MKMKLIVCCMFLSGILSLYAANHLVTNLEILKNNLVDLKQGLEQLKPSHTPDKLLQKMDEIIDKVMVLKNPNSFLENMKGYLQGAPFTPEREPEVETRYPQIRLLENEVQAFITELQRLPHNDYLIDSFIKKIDRKIISQRPLPPLPERKETAPSLSSGEESLEKKEEVKNIIAKRLEERRKAFVQEDEEEEAEEEEFPELAEIIVPTQEAKQSYEFAEAPTEDILSRGRAQTMVEKMRQQQAEKATEEEVSDVMWD
jgi:hypothetical protein